MAISSFSEACKVLGINENASVEDMRKAYHKKALECHPDKRKGDSSNNYDEEFKRLKQAYDYLTLDNDSGPNKCDSTIVVDNSSLYAFMFFAMCPNDVVVEIIVPFSEIYNRRVKKIEIKVKRWSMEIGGVAYATQTQTLLIPLSTWRPESPHRVFPNCGDDSVIFGFARSSIRIEIVVKDIDISVKVDDLFNDHSIFVKLTTSLSSYYLDKEITIKLAPGVSISFPNEQKKSYYLKGRGLPLYGQSPDRGDIYVSVIPKLPILQSSQLTDKLKRILIENFSTM